jgi:hypothetical protein
MISIKKKVTQRAPKGIVHPLGAFHFSTVLYCRFRIISLTDIRPFACFRLNYSGETPLLKMEVKYHGTNY